MKLLQESVAYHAERRPDSPAIVMQDRTVTYRELEESTNRLAKLLRAAGCRRGDRVGLLLPKSVPAIVGMLGALKADCAYVPMDTTNPASRLTRMMEACESRCILATNSTASLLQQILASDAVRESARIGWMDAEPRAGMPHEITFTWDDVSAFSAGAMDYQNTGDDVAHILFTSGSTGIPKGVVITHSNVMHFIQWATRYFGTAPEDRISGHPPLHFDLSTFDIHGTFLAGAQLYPVPPEMSVLPHKLGDFIRRNELTQWFSVPSILKYMAQFDVVKFDDFPCLKRLLWCGEALPTPTLIHWMKRLPRVTFTNLYGPTEATIASSYYTVPACPEDEKADISIGQACVGEELMVLDEALRPVPPGDIGDLYLRGVGLSPGYWKDPQKTEAVFLQNPHSADPADRIYKTGDLARVGADGLVYLLGRADSQIKSRGYRIELGEIETALHTIDGLRECAVVGVATGGFEGTAICCAYTPAPGVDLPPSALRKRLSELVPSYMMPSQWLALESLPLNGNGKIDRPRLRERFQTASAPAQ